MSACRTGFYKPANETAGCQQCPPHSGTEQEGAERCDCLEGYDRLPYDPPGLGCTSTEDFDQSSPLFVLHVWKEPHVEQNVNHIIIHTVLA